MVGEGEEGGVIGLECEGSSRRHPSNRQVCNKYYIIYKSTKSDIFA